jgi:hypothetical protein
VSCVCESLPFDPFMLRKAKPAPAKMLTTTTAFEALSGGLEQSLGPLQSPAHSAVPLNNSQQSPNTKRIAFVIQSSKIHIIASRSAAR